MQVSDEYIICPKCKGADTYERYTGTACCEKCEIIFKLKTVSTYTTWVPETEDDKRECSVAREQLAELGFKYDE